MARFLNKNELIVVILIILLFDLNGACFEFLNYIIFKSQKGLLAIMLVIIFLLVDTYIYHRISNIVPMPDVKYKPNNVRNINTCEEEINIEINKQEEIIYQLEHACDSKGTETSTLISEKIVLNFIAVVLIIIVICSLSVRESSYKPGTINSLQTRSLRSVLIFIIAVLYIYVANFKLGKNN